MTARLRETYKNTVFQQLMDQFKYENVMEVPKLEKVTINMGLGESLTSKLDRECLLELK